MTQHRSGPPARETPRRRAGDFKSLEAQEIFCTRCRRAVPVRKRLLLVLLSEERYDYLCAFCGKVVGGKTETAQPASVIIK